MRRLKTDARSKDGFLGVRAALANDGKDNLPGAKRQFVEALQEARM